MYCSKCGKKNEDSAKFCIKCGSSFTQEVGKTSNSTPTIKKSLVGVNGWLAWFILGIFVSSVINILSPIINSSAWGFIDAALGAYGIYVGYLLVKIRFGAVKHVRIYLCGVVLLAIVSIIIVSQNLDLDEETKTTFMGEAGRSLVLAIIWAVYFSVSKRVKATYTH